MLKLDGPRIPALSQTPKHLVVFLHGYGADGRDLIDIGQHWQVLLPDTAFVSPNAPEACCMSPIGRQWFALSFRDESERWRGVNQAQAELQAFLDNELADLNLNDSQLSLVGFSQGAMMALHVGLRRKSAPASIIGYSGMLVQPFANAVDNAQIVKPPVLLVHGDLDEVIPVAALEMSHQALVKMGVSCKTHISRGSGHGIDADGLDLGAAFIAEHFKIINPA